MSISPNSQNPELDKKRHSIAHLMAAAVQNMFPEAQFGVGPVIENGCYYDFILPRTLIPEDLPLIEAKMKEMLKMHLSFKVQELSLEQAIDLFNKNNQPLKVELLNDLASRGTTSMSEEERADFEITTSTSLTNSSYKVILFDLDGVIAKSYFEGRKQFAGAIWLQEKYNLTPDKTKDFWSSDFIDCTKGKKDLIEILPKFLKEWNIEKEVKEFIAEWLEAEDNYYQENLDFIKTLKQQGVKVYLTTNQEKYRTKHIQEKFIDIFDKIYSSSDLGCLKTDSSFWEKVLEDIGLNPSDCLLIDDQQKKLDIAKKFGIDGMLFFEEKDILKKKFSMQRQNLRFGVSNLPTITLYRIVNESTGEILFEDLCKGPHVSHVKELKGLGLALDKFSASYWRGDQKRDIRMQRIYALIMETKEEVASFLTLREEAKKRDHRVLGGSLKLFTISELVGSGLPLLQPKGAIIRKLLEDYLWQLQKDTHQRVYTPHITKEDLYEKSGHAGKYLEDMFKVYGGTSKETFFVKPMNCPMHMQIFADNQFSYKDMPVRYFDPTTVYRDEKTGQLSGLTRVRSITQDDGHLFCRVSQIQEEFTAIVKTIRSFYGSLGMVPDWVSWSVRDASNPEKYLGDTKNWDIAEEAIRQAAEANGLEYRRKEGEAAFYGPKLDFMFKDCIGREWQLSTIQCDFVQPERFDLSFTNEDGGKERPVVIHRAISGSLERFMGILIEHFAGRFPLWLAPVQVKILTINNQMQDYVEKVKAVLDATVLMKPLKYNELRYELDDRSESLGKKIREAEMEKVPVILIVGPKDAEIGQVSVRTQEGESKVGLDELEGYLKGL
ncbi:MAG: threonine--tRNA ligase [bacterium]